VRVGRHEPGRGAWLCDDSGCFDLAVRRRALARALRTDLTESDVSRLRVRLYGEPDRRHEANDQQNHQHNKQR